MKRDLICGNPNSTSGLTCGMVGVIATLAVASGITLETEDDLYDICNLFEKVNADKQIVKDLFSSSVKIGTDGLVSVGSDFIDLVKNTFDFYFNTEYPVYGYYNDFPYLGDFPVYNSSIVNYMAEKGLKITASENDLSLGGLTFKYISTSYGNYTNCKYDIYNGSEYLATMNLARGCLYSFAVINSLWSSIGGIEFGYWTNRANSSYFTTLSGSFANYVLGNKSAVLGGSVNYEKNWVDNLEKEEDGNIKLNVPKDLTNLVGLGVNGVLNPNYPLTDGIVFIPNVSNPSIDFIHGAIPSNSSSSNTSSETSYSVCGNILQNIIDGVKSTYTPVTNVEIILDAISNQNTNLTIVPKTNFEELLYKYLKKDKTNLPNPTTLDEIILHSKISGTSVNVVPETSVQILLNKLKNI